jgi:hypothetical protein
MMGMRYALSPAPCFSVGALGAVHAAVSWFASGSSLARVCFADDSRNPRGNAVSMTAALNAKWASVHFMGLSKTKKADYLKEAYSSTLLLSPTRSCSLD